MHIHAQTVVDQMGRRFKTQRGHDKHAAITPTITTSITTSSSIAGVWESVARSIAGRSCAVAEHSGDTESVDFVNESSGLPETYLCAAIAPGVDNYRTDDVDQFGEAGRRSTNTDVVFLSANLPAWVGEGRSRRRGGSRRSGRPGRPGRPSRPGRSGRPRRPRKHKF